MENIKRFSSEEIDSVERIDYNINSLLSCEIIEGREVMIHVNYAKDLSLSEKLRLLKEGFSKLAKWLAEIPLFDSVGLVTATSWIVTEHPKLMERLGFEVDNENGRFLKNKDFYMNKGRKKSVALDKIFVIPSFASIPKEKFIELYYKH